MRTSSVFNEILLKVDVSRRGAGRTCLMFVVITTRCDEYVVMVKTGNECQPQPTCRHTVTSATMACCAEVLFQSANTLLAEHETSNASVVIWSGERSTPSTKERNSAQSEGVLTRLVVHSAFPDSRLYRAQKRVLPTIHAWIVLSCVVVARDARTTCSRT